ncbi:MAG TPA: redox-sensing transcriptional repressor Rex [bacterium]|nr:redox-sensing transcriptional repressor Rex [bacterium]
MNINKQCIIRLSRYRNALNRFRSLGFVKVFSDNLGDAVGVTPAQVRKDFSLFGISGNKKGGYQIDQLLEKLNSILGKDEVHKVVIVGCGHIASALLRYKGFEKEGIRIAAGFDIDPAKVNRAAAPPVLPLEELKEYVKANGIKTGIIAVPDIAAQQVHDMMLSAGIKGVLNFAPIRLKGAEDCIINNINVEYELENVIYYVNAMQKTGRKP